MDIDNATAVTRGLQGWCYAIAIREHFAVATAALVVGLESQVPSIYRRQYPVLLEKYGFTEDEAEFFDLHITSDEIHGERGYQIVLEHADTPELQQRCAATRPPRSGGTVLVHQGAVRHLRRPRRASVENPDAGARLTTLRRMPAHPLLDHRSRRSRSPRATRSTCSASPSATTAASRSSAPAATAAPTGCGVEAAPRTVMPARRRERDRLGELLDQGYRLACQTYVSGRRHRGVGSRPDRAGRRAAACTTS